MPVLTKCMLTSDIPLGLRVFCMVLLGDAAQALSQRTPTRDDKVSEVFKTINSITTADAQTVGSSTVTHPNRLKLKSKPTIYYRNAFATVSHLFFVPLCTLLAPRGDLSKSIQSTGLDTILPCKAFGALSVILQCSANTIYDRYNSNHVFNCWLITNSLLI